MTLRRVDRRGRMNGEAKARPVWVWTNWSLVILMAIGVALMLWFLIAKREQYVGPVPTPAFWILPWLVSNWIPGPHPLRLRHRVIFTVIMLACLLGMVWAGQLKG